MTSSQASRDQNGAELRLAFTAAAQFAVDIAHADPAPAADRLRGIGDDIDDGAVMLDARGLTPGAYDAVVRPARDWWRRWRDIRAVFMARLEPARPDIEALGRIPPAVAELRRKSTAEIEQLQARWAARAGNAQIATHWEVAQAVFQQESLRHGQRQANLAAHSPFYWAGLLLIGVAEWLINYDTFLIFTGVVAIAAGATIILAVLLAFAAHGHGEVLKQWSTRFGRFQTPEHRRGSWRLLALSSFAVIVVLAAAGGSRYAAVLRGLNQAQQPDIIGGNYQLAFNPLRDVLLSLLANIAAWIVGVFISYFCHDADPDLMAAAWQHRRAGRAYIRARRRLEQEVHVIQERTTREVAALEQSAAARHAAREAERGMLIQIDQHDLAITASLLARLGADLARYRAELLRAAAARDPAARFARPGDGVETQTLSSEAVAALPILVDRALLETGA